MARTARKQNKYFRQRPVFLAEWRDYRKLTQEEAAPKIGMSRANLSRIETGAQQYNEDALNAIAEAYGCSPAGLLEPPPAAGTVTLSQVWVQIPLEMQPQAIAILSTFIAGATSPAVNADRHVAAVPTAAKPTRKRKRA